MSGWMDDLRQGARLLNRMRGFTALAVLTLAVAIGANTAMFTVAEDILLRPLPYRDASRIALINVGRSEVFSTSWLNYRDIRDQATHSFEQVAVYAEDFGVVQSGHPGAADASAVASPTPRVSANLIPMLGVAPILGRSFTTQEEQQNGPAVVLLSEGIWREAFHADPAIVGQTIRINDQPHTVVGVMPASFRFPESLGQDVRKAVWLPLQPTPLMLNNRGYSFDTVLARVRPGVSPSQVQSELDRVSRFIDKQQKPGRQPMYLHAVPYAETVTGKIRPVFLGLLAALGLVLLIACANVANLMIARCLGRQQEFAVHAALGAPRLRLMRRMLVEGALLSAMGCGLGIGLAAALLQGVRSLPPDTIPRVEAIHLDWTVLLVLTTIAATTTILSALLPALLAAQANPQRALQASSRGLGGRSVSQRLSQSLVIGEVALSTLLLIATGLLFHTLWNLEHAQLGFATERVTGFTVVPADAAGFSAWPSAARPRVHQHLSR